MISLADFQRIVAALEASGWARQDIEWSENIEPPRDAAEFALEAIFVICNSGMHHVAARNIFERCRGALEIGRPVADVFGHEGKAAAIEKIWRERKRIFADWSSAQDKTGFLRGLPWIGPITCLHLAKNFGLDTVKPDVHLARLARLHETTPLALCQDLARQTGYRVATIDTLLWRACATGVLCSRTGTIRARDEAIGTQAGLTGTEGAPA